MRTRAPSLAAFAVATAAMAAVVVTSNILVQHPVAARLGPVDLADVLTWGAFSYPIAFLVTDVVNRTFGPELARRVAFAGFAVAVVMSALLAGPRIAVASGTAFLSAQLFDVFVFNRVQAGPWWRAPLTSSLSASALDTTLFFTLAFSALIPFAVDPFATEIAPLFGILPVEAPRWTAWAIADFTVKILMAGVALGPYRVLVNRLLAGPAAGKA